jgi:hypothetical protein
LHIHEEQMQLHGGSEDQHLQINPMQMDEIWAYWREPWTWVCLLFQ